MGLYEKILLTTDFSEPSARALQHAVIFARMFGARVHAVFVAPVSGGSQEHAVSELRRAIPVEFDDVIEDRRVVCSVSPEIGILDTAREESFDLIVMGTHGRTGLKHVLLGSVAERVVQMAGCAVLTVRSQDPMPGQTEQGTRDHA